MDSRTISEDLNDIAETRASMTNKLVLLEERVQDAVEEAKATVLDVMDNVKGTAEDLAERTKRTFDPIYQTNQHPWIMLGGAIVAGYVLARLGANAAASPSLPRANGALSTLGAKVSEIQRGLVDDVVRQAQDEVEHIKDAVVLAARGFMRDLAKEGLAVLAELLERPAPPAWDDPAASRRLSRLREF
jgi:ElaB/YqjD/DUF883 family membrane-anchored ribosome-binding protein